MFFSFINSLIKPLKRIKQDMKNISVLCLDAERHAHSNGEEKPGAEHFLLAALELPDGSAKRVFDRLDIDPAGINQAIKNQHIDALHNTGLDDESIVENLNCTEITNQKLKLYDTTPSGQAVLQSLYQLNKKRKTPLIGAHVLEVIASMKYGIAARTLTAMGIDNATLKVAIANELD
jgi:ATP-dependent Clp protease ATP-binding subunit ClpA